MVIWFNNKIQDISGKKYQSKSISFNFTPYHFLSFYCKSNGAIKGIDKCYDLNIHFFGIIFSYTNWDYNS